jgi:hypothetical protein
MLDMVIRSIRSGGLAMSLGMRGKCRVLQEILPATDKGIMTTAK